MSRYLPSKTKSSRPKSFYFNLLMVSCVSLACISTASAYSCKTDFHNNGNSVDSIACGNGSQGMSGNGQSKFSQKVGADGIFICTAKVSWHGAFQYGVTWRLGAYPQTCRSYGNPPRPVPESSCREQWNASSASRTCHSTLVKVTEMYGMAACEATITCGKGGYGNPYGRQYTIQWLFSSPSTCLPINIAGKPIIPNGCQ